jgi:tRNA A-37 threonylcarbamoyl transferase component Bud32
MGQELIEIELGNYRIQFIHAKGKLKPQGIFSEIKPISIFENTKINEVMGKLFTEIEKKYSKIKAPPIIKRQKQEVEDECVDLIEKIEKTTPFASGFYGKIRDWDDGVIVKTESCERFNRSNKISQSDYDYFIKSGQKRIIIIEPLVELGITPRIYEINRCGDTCITFMEKIDGYTLNKIFKHWDKKTLFIEDYPRGDKLDLIFEVLKVVRVFHEIMHKSGYDFGHGDLHFDNIMITKNWKIKLIDFAFEKKESMKKDYEKFFLSVKNANFLYKLNLDYDKLKEMIKYFLKGLD